jgi:hypothetical protein
MPLGTSSLQPLLRQPLLLALQRGLGTISFEIIPMGGPAPSPLNLRLAFLAE